MFITGLFLIDIKKYDLIFLSDFDLLREHYRTSHYFCETGACKDVQFTNVFSSELEFRAHQATNHSKSRSEAKKLGTIPMEFQSTSGHDRRRQDDPVNRGLFKFCAIISLKK
jgi:hypothetical protein